MSPDSACTWNKYNNVSHSLECHREGSVAEISLGSLQNSAKVKQVRKGWGKGKKERTGREMKEGGSSKGGVGWGEKDFYEVALRILFIRNEAKQASAE